MHFAKFRAFLPHRQNFLRKLDGRGADIPTGAALGAEVGDITQRRQIPGQEDADGSGIDPAVQVGAPGLEDRADVEAGPAAQAIEGFPKLRLSRQATPAVVQDEQIKVLRTAVGSGLQTVQEMHQRGEALARGAGRQEAQAGFQVI